MKMTEAQIAAAIADQESTIRAWEQLQQNYKADLAKADKVLAAAEAAKAELTERYNRAPKVIEQAQKRIAQLNQEHKNKGLAPQISKLAKLRQQIAELQQQEKELENL